MKRTILSAVMFVVVLAPAWAKVTTKTLRYQTEEGQTMQGYLAWPDDAQEKRPGILVIHEWWGLNDFARGKAEQLAELGYVAFAVDMYGEGKTTTHPETAGEWARAVRGSDLMRQRAVAGLEVLKQQENVDTDRLGAIGFCFGGTGVLQLAYSGADVDGVVTFHGGLVPPGKDDRITGSILVCHGSEDPFESEEAIREFKNALEARAFDWRMYIYGGAKHSFTNPAADEVEMEGLGYDEKAARRSWQDMQVFFNEVFSSDEKAESSE